MDRILCLPQDLRSPEDAEGLRDLINELTEKHKKPGGTWTLKPAQALALDTLREQKGCVAGICVGGGKTLISALAPRVMGLDPFKTVLLTRAKLIDPWIREFQIYRKHFNVNQNIHLISYTKLSHPDEGPVLLERLRPDLIIADEAHALASEDSSRRNRFSYYFERFPETMLLAMSGTQTKKSIKDFAHLLEIALGDRTPIPRSWSLRESLCACVDPQSGGSYAKKADWRKITPLNIVYGDGRNLEDIFPVEDRRQAAREAFHNRLSTTPGVVQTSLDTVAASITIEPITDLKIPKEISEAIARAEQYVLPNEDEIETILAKVRAIKQIAQGVYYFWDWPGEEDWEWVLARRKKSREIRRAIKEGPRKIDSPTLVKRAIAAGGVFDHDEDLLEAWEKWQPHRDKDAPPTRPHWISEYMIEDVIKRAKKRGSRPPAIVWYQHRYVAEKLAERGLDWYDPEEGRNPELADPADGPIVLSVDSHVEGLNLQHSWRRNLILCPPTDAGTWEQLMGRTHRSGQLADEVEFEVYAHVEAYRKALKKAQELAVFRKVIDGDQKLLIADWTERI